MKKIKLVGIKKGWFGREIEKIIADIYVQDGKVIVESKYPKLKEELQKELDGLAYTTGAFGIRKCRDVIDEKGRNVTELYQINQKPGDAKFLEALLGAVWFWGEKKFNDYKKEFGGYLIIPTISKIVEE
ncbi:MAG: hypothetical protein NTV77_00820 [Candidatus Azambacteria bacterium]|nr:hypothetical protein [Candidatus Azambacteria bacterium]